MFQRSDTRQKQICKHWIENIPVVSLALLDWIAKKKHTHASFQRNKEKGRKIKSRKCGWNMRSHTVKITAGMFPSLRGKLHRKSFSIPFPHRLISFSVVVSLCKLHHVHYSHCSGCELAVWLHSALLRNERALESHLEPFYLLWRACWLDVVSSVHGRRHLGLLSCKIFRLRWMKQKYTFMFGLTQTVRRREWRPHPGWLWAAAEHFDIIPQKATLGIILGTTRQISIILNERELMCYWNKTPYTHLY